MLSAKNEKGKSKYLCDYAFESGRGGQVHAKDNQQVTLSSLGATLYNYTYAQLVKTIKKLNSLLPAEAQRSKGRAKERWPSQTRVQQRAAKAAKKGSRPRTNTQRVKEAKEKLASMTESRIHRTQQRDASRDKAKARKKVCSTTCMHPFALSLLHISSTLPSLLLAEAWEHPEQDGESAAEDGSG